MLSFAAPHGVQNEVGVLDGEQKSPQCRSIPTRKDSESCCCCFTGVCLSEDQPFLGGLPAADGAAAETTDGHRDATGEWAETRRLVLAWEPLFTGDRWRPPSTIRGSAAATTRPLVLCEEQRLDCSGCLQEWVCGAPPSALSTLAYFVGCISDVTVNSEIINFADSTEKKNGNVNGCPSDVLAYDPAAVPMYFPGGENELLPRPVPENTLHLATTTEGILKKTGVVSTTSTTTTTTSTTTTSTTTTTTTKKPLPDLLPDLEPEPEPEPEPERELEPAAELERKPEPAPASTTATRKPKVLPEPKKPDDPRCKLPVRPDFDVDFTEAGYRFFSLREQRVEIPWLPVKLRKHYDISLQFRTGYPSGLLFYAADKRHTDFIAVYVSEGRVHHQIRVGPIVANISSNVELNDDAWHTIEFVRTSRKISLVVDGVEQDGSTDVDERSARPMMVEFPVYVGGIPKHIEEDVRSNTDQGGNRWYYNGCLREIKVNGLPLEKEPHVHGVVPCSEEVENGLFFSQPVGYVKLFERFTVGTDFSINFDIRPRDPNGLLFSVHGKNAYMILELVDNNLWFTVKSDSKNIVVTNYTLPDNGSYCDGRWRNVQAVKSKFVITISVDYISTNPGVGQEGSTLTKTNRPLFLGGHQAFNKAPGLKTKKTFKGCMRNVQINKKPVRITPDLIYGEIWQGVCPLK